MNIEFYNQLAPQLTKHHSKLICVTKNQSIDAINVVYNYGLRIFGENRVQELCSKYESLPKDIEWHLIGHLQSNKVKYIAPFIHCIHSVDSLKLLVEINEQAKKHKRIITCLLQCFIAQEDTKFGLDKDELIAILENEQLKSLTNIEIIGLMGMATNTSDETQIKAEFETLKNLFLYTKNRYFSSQVSYQELSMGMSSDYEIALACGSTYVRIGSSIFSK